MSAAEKLTNDVPALSARLDAMTAEQRLAETLSLNKRQQAELFEAAQGLNPLTLEFLVPAAMPAMAGVAHEGRNSLALFTRFAKVFCRPDEPAAAGREVWGYNRTSGFISTAVGPGYFVAYQHDKPGELLVDYLRQPPRHPPDWPEIISNSARLSRVVYNGTQDVLRGVSRHVSIGRASRNGKWMDNWFVLCRSL